MAIELDDTTTETAEEVLKRLERMVRRAGEFALGFVRCNSPLQCSQMSEALKARLADLRFLEIALDEPIISVLDRIKEQWSATNPPDLVCIYGLEKSINPERDYSPVLGRLNHDRELIRKAVPVPLLIWLPDFALDCLVRGAPDFWAWRSGVYEFPTDTTLWYADVSSTTWHNAQSILSLPEPYKRAEIARLEELVHSARSLPHDSLLPHQVQREHSFLFSLLYQLGSLYESLGEYSEAQHRYQQSLQMAQQAGKDIGIASVLHQLGVLRQRFGDLKDAQCLYDQSLHISQSHDYDALASNTLHQMGMLQEQVGNLDAAQRLYEESLQIARKLGNRSGIADSIHQLAMLHQRRDQLDEAQRLYEINLEHYRNLVDRSGTAHTLHQLGRLQQRHGNLDAAQRLYDQSLQIWRDLGDRNGTATTLGQIGLLERQYGKLRNALQSLIAAWKLFAELKSPYTEFARQQIRLLHDNIGEQLFETWLAEDFGKEANRIIQALKENRSAERDGQ